MNSIFSNKFIRFQLLFEHEKSYACIIIFNLSRTQFTTQKIENGYDIAVTLASPKNSTLALDIWFSRQNQPKKKKKEHFQIIYMYNGHHMDDNRRSSFWPPSS